MKSLCNTILLAVLFAGALQSQTSKQDRQGSPTGSNSSNPASSVSVHEYREILQNERKLLDDQSEKYYVRIDALIDRTLWVIGVICMIALGLFRWQFGKTRREMEDIVHEEFTKRVASLIDLDMAELKAQVKELQAQVKELQAHVPKELITAKVEGKDTVTAAQEVRPAVDSDLKQSIEQAENLVRLVDHEVHKLVKFRTRVMVERRAGKSLKPPINAHERRMFPSALIGVHRRFPTSAV